MIHEYLLFGLVYLKSMSFSFTVTVARDSFWNTVFSCVV